MIDEDRRERVFMLLQKLKRQFPLTGAYTAQLCAVCREEAAVGTAACWICLRDELAKIVGFSPAQEYVDALRALRDKRDAIDEILDGMDTPCH